MKKQTKLFGSYKIGNRIEPFSGTVRFDERENSIYYSWNLTNIDRRSIAEKSLNVGFQQIPVGQDRFEFSRKHAIERIKKYRMGREKIIQELRVG
jgi:hypothetical protein